MTDEITAQNRKTEMMTTRELAEALGVSNMAIKRVLEKTNYLNGTVKVENGKTTIFTEEQATLIKQEIQRHHNLASRQIDNIAVDIEKIFSVKEIAENIGTSYDVINNAVKRVFPEVIKNGKKTMLSKIQVTELIEELKSHTKTTEQLTFEAGSKVAKVSTLTPALKIKKAMELMQEGYEEELAILRAKNAEMQPNALVYDRICNGKGCFSMNQAAKALGLPYGNRTLFRRLREDGCLNADNSPTQRQIKEEHFKVVVKYVSEQVGNKPVPLVTYLAKKFNTQIDETVRADA